MVNPISVPNGWILISDANDHTLLELEDSSDDDFFLSARIAGGVVTFGIATRVPGKKCSVSGETLFDIMIDHFGVANIHTIRGRWNSTTDPAESANLETFNRLTNPPAIWSDEQAALKTFTGKMAQRKLGFTKVRFTAGKRIGTPGNYVQVEVDFSSF